MGDNATNISQDLISLFFGGSLPKMHPFPSSASSSNYQALEMGSGDDSGAGSEEGLDVPEEPARAVPHRSGSKRSRAAEVHNLSEKRRRSRINEKMRALQNLIPNSNKTDKASMLDEVIEYLKQLQLQVQMLSMRNGLTSYPTYLPGSLHPLQAFMNFGELGFQNLNQDSVVNNSFNLSNQCTANSHRSVMLSAASVSAPEPSFVLEPSLTHHATFPLRVPGQYTFTEEIVSHRQLDSARTAENLPENVMKTVEVASSLCCGAQAASSLDHNDHLSSVLSKDDPDDNPIFIQNFDVLQASESFAKDDKSEAQGM